MILDPGALLIVAVMAAIAAIPVTLGREHNWLHKKPPPEDKG